eukprot:XP_022272030.1 collagen alpha-1(II) chain-like isoform X2 [Canis lupus familiaris]
MSARPLLTRQAPPPAAASRNPGRAVRCPPRGGLGGPLLTSAPFLSRRGPPRALPQTVVPSVGGSSAARPAPLRAALPRASGLRRPSRRPPSSPSASPPPGRRPSEALPGAMSASGDPGQAPGGQDSPVGAVGAWAPVAAGGGGGGNGVVLESGPQQAQAAGVAGSAGGVGMEVVGLHLAIDPEGGGAHAEEAEDDSDFGPADEDGEEAPEDDLDILVDAHQFPMGQLHTSMKTLTKRPKALRGGKKKRNLTINKTDLTRRDPAQQRTGPENPVGRNRKKMKKQETAVHYF